MKSMSCRGRFELVSCVMFPVLLGVPGIGHATPPLSGNETQVACRNAGSDLCAGASEYFEHQTPRSSRAPKAAPGTENLSIGLALAGGGTRASQFSIGVMKGLFESGLLENIDYLSTVSGGGYAGYWYMAQRIYGADPVDMFRDCIPGRYKNTAQRLLGRELMTCTAADVSVGAPCLCPQTPKGRADDGATHRNLSNVLADLDKRVFSDPFRFQNTLRGHTDLFVPSFSYTETRSDERLLPSIVPAVAVQLLTASTIDLVGDVLFDWNLNTSVSRTLYRDGIRRIYGQPPVDCAAYLAARIPAGESVGPGTCLLNRPLADEAGDSHPPAPINFSDLRANVRGGKNLPYWIINATTPVLNCPKVDGGDGCVRREVFGDASYPPHKATFEFTPDFWGAGEFGYWRMDGETRPFGDGILSADEAVASSAAFFDPNQRSFMLGGLVNGLLQISGFRWGNYIQNPHVSNGLRREHRMIPLFYVFHHWIENKDAVDVHLIDGGQSDNLGAYGLIRRRVPNIIISDHAGEGDSGNMEDICRLRKNLALPEFAAWNEGRIWHIHFDDLESLDKVCNVKVDPATLHPTVPQVEQRYRYNVHAWKQPVLRGCAIEMERGVVDESLSCAKLKEAYPNEVGDTTLRHLDLFLIKPALDLASYGSATPLPAGASSGQIGSDVELHGFLRANAGIRDALDIIKFPNHSTVNLTLDSSPWLFGAYRELAARAARQLSVKDGRLVVNGNDALPPMRPQLSYQINRESQAITKRFVEALASEAQ